VSDFKLTHGSATLDKALRAATRVESVIGRTLNGDRKALGTLSPEDVALLVQYVRDSVGKEKGVEMSEPAREEIRCTACGGTSLSLTGRHDSNGECECRFAAARERAPDGRDSLIWQNIRYGKTYVRPTAILRAKE
jgi:hypothetical protein